ncbi:MAG TPA: caspase family protein [Hyphomicrobiaceae bacterium]|nr:caspase family protein [Hyphomicrobiaceae bacterium]
MDHAVAQRVGHEDCVPTGNPNVAWTDEDYRRCHSETNPDIIIKGCNCMLGTSGLNSGPGTWIGGELTRFKYESMYLFRRGMAYLEIGNLELAHRDVGEALRMVSRRSEDPNSEPWRLSLVEAKAGFERVLAAQRDQVAKLAEREARQRAESARLAKLAEEAQALELLRKEAELKERIAREKAAALELKRRHEMHAADEARKSAAVASSAGAPVSARPLQPILDPSRVGRRVALLIGNARYANAPPLVNPPNDVRAVAAALRRLGFSDVVERHDQTLAGFKEALKSFGDTATNADWALIYFAGHGIQVGQVNYVLPTDARLSRVGHVEDEAVALQSLLSKVEEARGMRMVIIDACRENPFLPRSRLCALARARTGAGRSSKRYPGRVLGA